MATRPLIEIPQGTPFDPRRLLGDELYFGGGGAIFSQEARKGTFGRYAVEQQAIVDTTTRQAQTSFLGVPGTPPLPGPDPSSILPPGFRDPLTGAFKLPEGMRRQLKAMGGDPDDVEGRVTRNLHARAGGDYQQRLLYGQGIAGAPDKSLQQAKEELFSKVARAVQASPDQRDRILEAAFAGPNSDALLAEYDTATAKAAHEEGVLSDIKKGVSSSFGNLMAGLGGAGDVVRASLATLVGARNAAGREVTAADIGKEVGQLPKDLLNVLTLGTAGALKPGLRSTSEAPGFTQIQRTMRTRGLGDEIASIAIPLLGLSRAADQIPGVAGDVTAEVFGFLGDIGSDPTTYLTLGGGGLGKGAIKAAGTAASRAKFLKHLGMDDMIPQLARADEFAWEQAKSAMAPRVGDRAMAEAEDVAKAFQISAENAHGAQGWAGYRSLLDSQGLNADALFPRGVGGFGPEAKMAATMVGVRGGIGLRGGISIPRTKLAARAAINLRSGRGFSPMGTWFTKEGNRFHQLASQALNKVAEVVHYGSGADREWVHNNRGLFNATMEAATKGQGVRHQFDNLAKQAQGAGGRLKKFLREPENTTRLIDIIEKGERSPYWSLVDDEVRAQAEVLSDLLQQGRTLAAVEGVDIPMLREIADDPDTLDRYFPHKVKQAIGEQGHFPVTPAQVGYAKARGMRAGSQITGPQGTSAMLTEGSFAEIQDVTQRILGAPVLESDPIATVTAYLASVGNASALTRSYNTLTRAGLLVPDVWDVAPGQLRGAGDPVRGIWTQPADRARRAVEVAQASLGKTSDQATKLLGQRASLSAQQVQVEAELAMYASRHADADSKISALRKTRDERRHMLATARINHATAKRESVALHTATRREMIDSARTELGQTKDQRKFLQRQLKALDRQHAEAMAEFDRGLAAQEEVLTATPEQIGRALKAEINELGKAAVGGHRPWNQVINELRATKHRLAQVEGGEWAAGRRGQLMGRATQAVKSQREKYVQTQRQAARQAADVNEEIAVASREVQAAVKASDPAAETLARGRLTELQTRRAELLAVAERSSQEAAELWQLVDAGEAAARFADLREAEVLAHQAGSVLEAQAGRMSENLRGQLTRLLEIHAADLVAESNDILAVAPRLKFLNRAMREFSVVDTSLPAIPVQGTGRALADFAQEYAARVEGRGDDMRGAWAAAVGDEAKAYAAASDEYKRQMSTLLAREMDLTRQLQEARNLDPKAQALATHQREGDQLNLFQAELHRNERELEWWMSNRTEVRATQTLKSLQLGAVTKENDELARAVGAAQKLHASDQQAALQAMQKAMTEPRIFNLMTPEIEHLAAITGKLPFMEGGAAMPLEVSRVLERVLTKGPESQQNFLKVLAKFNARWKRLVLLTPGSLFRRWFGNTYNAIVLAGVRPDSFELAFNALGARRQARQVSEIADPKLRRYMELAHEYNIFEGQLSALGEDAPYITAGSRNPVRKMGDWLQDYAVRGEDIARLAQFIDGLDSGMGAQAARMWTGKYHFFNQELTQAERNVLRPIYPFYAYLRNNYALQFHTLFAQPGKINLYGHAMRDFSAQPEGSTEPGWVTQSGGFPISEDTWLQNTLLDTSPLGLPQTVLGLAGRGPASGWSPTDLARGELTGSMSPLLASIPQVGLGVDPGTGEKMYPQDPGPGAKPFLGALQALGVVNDAGKINPRAWAAFQNLAPLGARASRFGGGFTAAQSEQSSTWWVSQLVGPGVQRQTERRARSAYGERGRVLDDLIASMNARGVEVPTQSDLTASERTDLLLRRLGLAP
jgi:hypothetical protein